MIERIALLIAVVLAAPAGVAAQNFPARPVTIISNAGAGTSPDVVARVVAERLSQLWGQQVVVVNQPGAGGAISANAAAAAPPDGYTLYAPALSVFLTLVPSENHIRP